MTISHGGDPFQAHKDIITMERIGNVLIPVATGILGLITVAEKFPKEFFQLFKNTTGVDGLALVGFGAAFIVSAGAGHFFWKWMKSEFSVFGKH